MPVRCNGRKDIVLSKAFDMYVLVAFKAIIFLFMSLYFYCNQHYAKKNLRK
jgi:hypothetical protein